jgi:hypothetical protein
MRMSHIALLPAACLAEQYFSTYLRNGTIFGKEKF